MRFSIGKKRSDQEVDMHDIVFWGEINRDMLNILNYSKVFSNQKAEFEQYYKNDRQQLMERSIFSFASRSPS
jgi:hypothetical protein